jgi:hypothetical protein
MSNISCRQWKILGLSVLTGVLVFFPLVFSAYDTSLLAKFIVFGIFALSLNLIWGYSGIVNFGHAIFFGGGAYVTGIVLKTLPVGAATYIAILAAIALTMLFAATLGYFLFYGRVSGVFPGAHWRRAIHRNCQFQHHRGHERPLCIPCTQTDLSRLAGYRSLASARCLLHCPSSGHRMLSSCPRDRTQRFWTRAARHSRE